MRVAVTGAAGFVGTHLTAELQAHGHEVVGIGREKASERCDSWVSADLAEQWPSTELGELDAVVHLAALAAVGPSFADPQRYYIANSAPLTHLAEALLESTARQRIVNVSTGAVYRPGTGLTETSETSLASPYVISKLLGEMQAGYYRGRGLDIVTVRPFNHVGPGQSSDFLLPDLWQGVSRGAVVAGDLTTRRDYTDVRDVVRAYRLLVEAPTLDRDVYNVCSGTTASGEEILALLLQSAGLETTTVSVTVDPDRIRPGDPRSISGSAEALRASVGWAPEIPLAQTVADFVRAAS